jgi:hypothetical protein
MLPKSVRAKREREKTRKAEIGERKKKSDLNKV